VLVSGLAQIGARWHRVAHLLSEDHTVVTLDNRECGGTGPCPEGFTLTDCAADVIETVDAIGLGDFVLAGISMGGMIAQEVMALAPQRIRAAALFATHGGGPSVVPPPDAAVLMQPDPRQLWTVLTGPGFAEANPEVIEEEAKISVDAATPLDGILRQLQAVFAFDAGEKLSALDVPIVVAHGDQDPLVPYENGVRLAKKLGCGLVTYEGAGHALEFERPHEVAELIRRHFGPKT
jgi:3-oxoadipate enol-lactonase